MCGIAQADTGNQLITFRNALNAFLIIGRTATVCLYIKCPFIIMLGIAQDCRILGDGWLERWAEHMLLRLSRNCLCCYAMPLDLVYIACIDNMRHLKIKKKFTICFLVAMLFYKFI